MGRRQNLWCLFIILINFETVVGQICTDGTVIGQNNPQSKDKKIDTTGGLSILMLSNNKQYTINCCGFVKQWHFYPKTNTGELRLQIWRPGTSPSYSLQGQNIVTVSGAELQTTVTETIANPTQWIPVQNNDVIGWYTPGLPMITYDNGNWIRTSTGVASSATYSWGTATAVNNRDYGINAVVTPGSSPTISNLGTPLTLPYYDDLAINSLILKLTVSDADTSDTLTTTMTSSTAYFTFSIQTLEIRTARVLSIGTHTLNFQVKDRCGHTDTGTVYVVVSNNPPIIHNMASAAATISEGLLIETQLFAINVTDASAGDFVTCDINSSTPAAGTTKFFTKLISGTSQFGIFVKDQPGLNYDVANKYDMVIECTDTKDPVTANFVVYIKRNQQPAFLNLQNSVTVSAKAVSIGTIIYNVSSSDPEDDNIFYSMTCTPAGAPFIIYNSGAVVSTVDLTDTTVTGYDCSVYINDSITQVGPKILTVTISDINHPPVITNLPIGSPISVAENGPFGATIYQVSVTDQNSLDKHTYTATFNPGVFANYIILNSNSGAVTTSATNNIDYESFTTKTADVTVTVSDGQDTDTALLKVTITNVNEAPVFIQNSYSISGNEGPAGTVIGTPNFDVNDPDGDNLTYSIDCTQFSIGATSGKITLASTFDCDAPNIATSTTIQCNVNVSDGTLQDTATLQVTLSNINDNAPILSKSSYTFFANANDDVGLILTGDPLVATDADAGVYGKTSFSLDQSSLPKQYFKVSSTGDIYIAKSLLKDFYSGTQLTFTGIVTDTGDLNDTATIIVVVAPYTTTTPTTTTDRYLTFWEDSKNVAWFTFLMIILAAIVALCLYWAVRSINWTKILSACKQRARRKWKWQPAVEERPGARLPPPPPPPQPKYIPLTPPPPPKQIAPSGVKWEYWKDQDFETGILG